MLVSPEEAIFESRLAYAATMRTVGQQGKFLYDPALANRVGVITGRLVGQAGLMFPHTRNWAWSVALINEPNIVNAWCMAGGKMAIYSGFVAQLNLTDDELAQLMGHEISHAIANHQAESMSVAIAQELGVRAVRAATDHEATIRDANMLANVALILPNSRAAEYEADLMGGELAARAGYDPAAGVSLWRKMEALQGWGRLPEFLQTHPSSGNRAQTLAALVPVLRPLMPAIQPPPVLIEVYAARRSNRAFR